VVAELGELEAPAHVEAALLTAFRQQVTTAAPVVIPMPVNTPRWRGWQRGAIAAGILIFISMLAIFWQRSGSRDQQAETRAVSPTPSSGSQMPLPMPSALDRDRVTAQQPVAPRPRHRVRHQAHGNNSDEAEVVTEFFPLRE